jgi:hypothetical protein
LKRDVEVGGNKEILRLTLSSSISAKDSTRGTKRAGLTRIMVSYNSPHGISIREERT